MSSTSAQEIMYKNDTSDYAEDIVVYGYYFERQVICAVLISGGIFGTIGNCFVVMAVSLSKKLQTATNVFVVNLAVADVMTCLITPWQAVAILGGDEWPIPRAQWVCTVIAFVVVVTIGCSVNNLALIAVNRWVGITKSRFTTRRIYTARKLALMVIFSWAIPICCALTPVLTDLGELGYETLYKSCTWVRSNPYSFYYNMLITAIYYPIQLIVIMISYSSIFCYVRRTSRKMTRADAPSLSGKISGGGGNRAMRRQLWKRQLDVTKNLLYIVLAFLICLTPYFVSILSSAAWSYRLVPWGAVILFCNSCANPIIYATSHPGFKEAFGHMIRCRKIPVANPSQRIRSSKTGDTRA
ncbi:melanopsin-A-like [Patiria miniata]|uniref:G-protein coupled receptors family 1 profile domain-containing protein n=1 Tax=Patiria miniata TaxID=46514 RepID=A0A913YYE4_PATMI|nr:melanopsin-A-like [Patiria miniata]